MFLTNKDITMITGARQSFLLRLNVHRKVKHTEKPLNPTQTSSLATCLNNNKDSIVPKSG